LTVIVNANSTASVMSSCLSSEGNTFELSFSFLFPQGFLVHFFNEHIDVIAHSFQILTKKLVLCSQKFLLLVILITKKFINKKQFTYIGQRLKDLRSRFHLVDLLLGFIKSELNKLKGVSFLLRTLATLFRVFIHVGLKHGRARHLLLRDSLLRSGSYIFLLGDGI
jgi:hypothetical protein